MAQPIDFVGLNTFIYEPLGWDTNAQADLVRVFNPIDGNFIPVEKIKNNNIPGLGEYNVRVQQNTFGYSLDVTTLYFSPNSFGTQIKTDNQTERLLNIKWAASVGQRLPDPQTGNIPFNAAGATRVKAQYLHVLNLRRNGPYGYPTWKQTRVSQNPLTRKQKQNNIFTYVIQGKEATTTSGIIKKDRYSEIFKFVETPVVSKYKPIEILAGVTDENTDKIRRAIIKAPMANDTAYFNHDVITRQMNLEYDESESYATIKKMYLHGALDSETSPIDSFEYVRYSETVFPSIKRAYQSHVRVRENFFFTWRKSNEYRVKPGVAFTGSVVHSAPGAIDNGFAFEVPYQSDWVLDAGWNILDFNPKQDGLFLTRTASLGLTQYDDYGRLKPTRASISSASVYYYPIGGAAPYWNDGSLTADRTAYNYRTGSLSSSAGGEGQLMNSYCLFTDWRQVSASSGIHPVIDQFLTASSLYSRKTLIPTVAGLAANSGKDLDFLDNLADPLLNIYQYFGGATKWEAPETRKKYNLSGVLTSSIRYPMYDDYKQFSEYTRLIGKDYSIVPEFRISNHIEFYQKQGLLEENPNVLQLSGASVDLFDSSKEEFFKVYSNSDFMKHFDIVKEDHNGFVEPSAISLKCNAIKKLLPYDGFYPAQRANQLAKQFYKSYGDHFSLEEASIQVTDFPDRISGTQTTELVFLPHHFNVIFEDSSVAGRGYYGHQVNGLDASFEMIHSEYPQITQVFQATSKHGIDQVGSGVLYPTNNKDNPISNGGTLWGLGAVPEKILPSRMHMGNMGLQVTNVMQFGLNDSFYDSFHPSSQTTDSLIETAYRHFMSLNIYKAHDDIGHYPALRQWKYWMGKNATNSSILGRGFESIYDNSGSVSNDGTDNNVLGGDLNRDRPNNLIRDYCGEVCEYKSSLYQQSTGKVGFQALNLIPDEFAACHVMLAFKGDKNVGGLTPGFAGQKHYGPVSHLLLGGHGLNPQHHSNQMMNRYPAPSLRGNSPSPYIDWGWNTTATMISEPKNGFTFGADSIMVLHGGSTDFPDGDRIILPELSQADRDELYPTSYKTQYPMTMVSDAYGNYVAFLFVKDEGDRKSLDPWSGFGGNSFYDDTTISNLNRMQRNYYVPAYRNTKTYSSNFYADNSLVLPSRVRTTSWSVSPYDEFNSSVYGQSAKGINKKAQTGRTNHVHWGINMSKADSIGVQKEIWEVLYNSNTGSSLHPTSGWTVLSAKPDVGLFTGYTHNFIHNTTSGIYVSPTTAHSPQAKTWSSATVPATANEYHPLEPPIVIIRVPAQNKDNSGTSDHEWSSYYAAKYMAEAINDINAFPDDPTGKYQHILPLYHAFTDAGIQTNSDILGELPADPHIPWIVGNRRWQVTATFSMDSNTDMLSTEYMNGDIVHPFARLQLSREVPDASTADSKYFRYIVNWNSGIVLNNRPPEPANQFSTVETPGAAHNDTSPNYLNDFFTSNQMDDFRVNHFGSNKGEMVAQGAFSHLYEDFSFTQSTTASVQTNPLSPLGANADSKYCRIQPLLNPLFAPGVLFNTIKSGIACDYPLMTDNVNRVLATVTGSEGDVSFWMIGSRGSSISAFVGTEDYFAASATNILRKVDEDGVEVDTASDPKLTDNFYKTASFGFQQARTAFDVLALKRNSNSNNFRGFNLRIPFDALIEPENYLAHQALINQEPDNFLYFDKYMRLEYETRWDGQGDQVYKKMAHNFLSEIPDFFLINGSLKSIKSLEQGDSNFGNVTGFKAKPSATEDTPYCYKMRVKIYKSLDKTANTIFSNGVKVTPPQVYIPENDARHPRETITMYSRPSSFGPPSWDGDFNVTYIDNNNKLVGSDNRKGYNFPFTPPYYHGEAWADITFKPKEIRKYTLSEILASSSVDYYRYWHPMTNTAIERRQSNSTIHFTNWTASLANPTGTVGNYYAPQHPLFVNDNAMQLDATLNLFGRTLEDQVVEREVTTPTVSPGAVGGLATALAVGSNTQIVVDTIQQDKARWVIQPKMETPILNFSHITSSNSPEITTLEFNTGRHPGMLTTNDFIHGDGDNFISINDGGIQHTIYFNTPPHFQNIKPTTLVGLIKVPISQFDSTETIATKTIEAINASSSLNASPSGLTGVQIESSIGGAITDAEIGPSATTNFRNSVTVTVTAQGSQSPPISLAKQSPFTTTVGMWHQYGVIPTGSQGVFMQIEDVPKTWMKGALGVHTGLANLTASLADLVGFPKTSQRLGEVAMTKKIYEAVVAIPFIEESNERKFFEIPRRDIDNALDPSPEVRTVGNSIVSMVQKMSRYVFPPTMDFLRNRDITPFAMYIFEFSHVFTRQDLIDIWQNVAPEIGVSHQTATAVITHELLSSELIGGGTTREHPNRQAKNNLDRGIPLPEKIKWMVFKVKQRAKTNYYDKVFQRAGVEEEDTARRLSKVSFNWPYDYFSLVELVKLDASVVLSDVEEAPVSPNDDSTRSIKPKITKLKVPRSLMKSLATTRPSDLANKQDIIKRIKAEKLDGFKFQLAGDDD